MVLLQVADSGRMKMVEEIADSKWFEKNNGGEESVGEESVGENGEVLMEGEGDEDG